MKNALILVTYILFLIPLNAVLAEETEKPKNTCSQMRIFSGGIDDSSLYLLSNTVIDPCLKKGFKTSLTISSGGGDVSPAIATYDSVRVYQKADLTTIATGTVASSAVLLYLTGNTREIMPNAFIFLHPIRTLVTATSVTESELQEKLEFVKALKESYINILTRETLLSRKEAEEMMRDGKKLTSDEALKYGFAHKILR